MLALDRWKLYKLAIIHAGSVGDKMGDGCAVDLSPILTTSQQSSRVTHRSIELPQRELSA